MNAIEARKKRKGPTLFEREMANPDFAERMQAEREAIALELQVRKAMEEAHISSADLARMLDVPRSTVTRDLSGGLSNAKLGRVRAIADKLNYDVIPLLLPREPHARKAALTECISRLQLKTTG